MLIHKNILGRRRSKRIAGVSLIEVLISIVIASIGLLALAGSNVSSVRYTKMSQYKGTATQLATDIGERMRANKAGLSTYNFQANFDTQTAVDIATLKSEATSAETLCNDVTKTCSAALIADFDLKSWKLRVRDNLPSGSIYIVDQSVNSGATAVSLNAADVWVVWQDPAIASDELQAQTKECPTSLSVGSNLSIRCSYFRINL